MKTPDVAAELPAPISLSFEEASKVAAGSSGLALSAAQAWWWKGQPAFAFLNQVSQVTLPAAVGQITTL